MTEPILRREFAAFLTNSKDGAASRIRQQLDDPDSDASRFLKRLVRATRRLPGLPALGHPAAERVESTEAPYDLPESVALNETAVTSFLSQVASQVCASGRTQQSWNDDVGQIVRGVLESLVPGTEGDTPTGSDSLGFWKDFLLSTLAADGAGERESDQGDSTLIMRLFSGETVPRPTPEQIDAMVEKLRALIQSLDDPTDRQIAELKLKRFSNEEIARRLDIAKRAVERKVGWIRSRLKAI